MLAMPRAIDSTSQLRSTSLYSTVFIYNSRAGSVTCLSFLSLGVPEAQVAAHGDAGVECLDAEVHGAVHVAEVGQLDPGHNKQDVIFNPFIFITCVIRVGGDCFFLVLLFIIS